MCAASMSPSRVRRLDAQRNNPRTDGPPTVKKTYQVHKHTKNDPESRQATAAAAPAQRENDSLYELRTKHDVAAVVELIAMSELPAQVRQQQYVRFFVLPNVAVVTVDG